MQQLANLSGNSKPFLVLSPKPTFHNVFATENVLHLLNINIYYSIWVYVVDLTLGGKLSQIKMFNLNS